MARILTITAVFIYCFLAKKCSGDSDDWVENRHRRMGLVAFFLQPLAEASSEEGQKLLQLKSLPLQHTGASSVQA